MMRYVYVCIILSFIFTSHGFSQTTANQVQLQDTETVFEQLHQTEQQLSLYKTLFWVTLSVMIIKTVLLGYFLLHYRRQRKIINQQHLRLENQHAQLERLDKLKDHFFANLSHELRTPLSLILGPISRLLQLNNLDERSLADLRMMQRNGRQLLRMIEELLDLSKLQANQLKLEEQTLAFYPLIRRLFSSFESYAQTRNIEMQLEYQPAKDLVLSLDLVKIERIMYNLLSNAIKFTPDEGLVKMRVEDSHNNIHIFVQDTGMGIEAKDLEHVFERFFQAKNSKENAYGGTGIGLALAKEYSLLMNGDLHVESKVGMGSTFKLTFPKKEVFGKQKVLEHGELDWGTEERPAVQAVVKPEHTREFTVMIVEDNSDMRDFIQQTISPYYHTLFAENGEIALYKLTELSAMGENIDLIITDLMMPQMDGYKMLERLKEGGYASTIPTIVLTARSGLSDRINALRFGVDDYLTKPFAEEELLVRMQNLLHNYKQRVQAVQEEPEDAAVISYNYWKETIGSEPGVAQEVDWLRQVEELALAEVGNAQFSITDLAGEMNLSERQLRRKLKQYIGLSPNQYLREIKLQKAYRLLEDKTYSTVSEVCYAVGLSTPKYFTKIFVERFGKLPTDLLR